MADDLIFDYEHLCAAKKAGTLPNWASITEAQLFELYASQTVIDRMVANLFDVSISKVRYRKRKCNVNIHRIILHEMNLVTTNSYERLLAAGNADDIAIALAHYIYRDGPIEDYHAENKLTNDEMMAQNKFSVNKIATILHLAREGQWHTIENLLHYYMGNGDHWDMPEILREDLRVSDYEVKVD